MSNDIVKKQRRSAIISIVLGLFVVVRRVLSGVENWGTLDWIFAMAGAGFVIYGVSVLLKKPSDPE